MTIQLAVIAMQLSVIMVLLSSAVDTLKAILKEVRKRDSN